VALQFNPNVDITAYHASIFEPQFSLEWFKSFDLVMNALDNVAARRHVNGMCLAASIPLVESGTAGYLGQVSIHLPLKTKCYDCDPKPSVRKTFPVCTIRSTPSESIHCIVWAKSYLFSHLFGADDGDQNDIKEEGDNGIFIVLKM
jgi:ubiquitin-like 1-activating enzyme E1 B